MLRRCGVISSLALVIGLSGIAAAADLELKFADALPKTFSYYPAIWSSSAWSRRRPRAGGEALLGRRLGDQKTPWSR
jgi:hypothetical protein